MPLRNPFSVVHLMMQVVLLVGCGAFTPRAAVVPASPAARSGSYFFGTCVASVGDIDADGSPDMIASAPAGLDEGPGRVFAISARTRRPIWVVEGGGREIGLGWKMCVLPDVDYDGIRDLAATCPNDRGGEEGRLSIWAISGRTGQHLWTYRESSVDHGETQCLAPICDMNGDGIEDLFATWTKPGSTPKEQHRELLIGIDSRTGCAIRTLDVQRSIPSLRPTRICAAFDANGDGSRDIALAGSIGSVHNGEADSRTVVLLCSRTGDLLSRIAPAVPSWDWGRCLAAIPDVTGTGSAGILVGGKNMRTSDLAFMVLRHDGIVATHSLDRGLDIARWEFDSTAWLSGPQQQSRLLLCSARDGSTTIIALDPQTAAPVMVIPSPAPEALWGWSIASAEGDVDGDGWWDFLVGVSDRMVTSGLQERPEGAVYVHSGRDGSVLMVVGNPTRAQPRESLPHR